MALKYKQASLYTILMVPHVCCIQSIKFLILSAVSAFAAKVLQNKSLKSQSFSEKKINHLFSQQSSILINIQGSWGLAGQSCCPWLGWAGLGWADLGWVWMEIATDDLSPILYPGLVGQPGHVFLMATAEVQGSR